MMNACGPVWPRRLIQRERARGRGDGTSPRAQANGGARRAVTIVLDEAVSTQLAEKARALGVDEAALAAWCVQTGLLLEDLNAFIRARLATQGQSP